MISLARTRCEQASFAFSAGVEGRCTSSTTAGAVSESVASRRNSDRNERARIYTDACAAVTLTFLSSRFPDAHRRALNELEETPVSRRTFQSQIGAEVFVEIESLLASTRISMSSAPSNWYPHSEALTCGGVEDLRPPRHESAPEWDATSVRDHSRAPSPVASRRPGPCRAAPGPLFTHVGAKAAALEEIPVHPRARRPIAACVLEQFARRGARNSQPSHKRELRAKLRLRYLDLGSGCRELALCALNVWTAPGRSDGRPTGTTGGVSGMGLARDIFSSIAPGFSPRSTER
jgi:hypothetical protein